MFGAYMKFGMDLDCHSADALVGQLSAAYVKNSMKLTRATVAHLNAKLQLRGFRLLSLASHASSICCELTLDTEPSLLGVFKRGVAAVASSSCRSRAMSSRVCIVLGRVRVKRSKARSRSCTVVHPRHQTQTCKLAFDCILRTVTSFNQGAGAVEEKHNGGPS